MAIAWDGFAARVATRVATASEASWSPLETANPRANRWQAPARYPRPTLCRGRGSWSGLPGGRATTSTWLPGAWRAPKSDMPGRLGGSFASPPDFRLARGGLRMLTKNARKGQTGAMITLERALRAKAKEDEVPLNGELDRLLRTEASRRRTALRGWDGIAGSGGPGVVGHGPSWYRFGTDCYVQCVQIVHGRGRCGRWGRPQTQLHEFPFGGGRGSPIHNPAAPTDERLACEGAS